MRHPILPRLGLILVPTARGGNLEEAVLGALASGRIADAGLDLFAREPREPGPALCGLAKVSLSPQVAGLDVTSGRLVAERGAASIPARLAGRYPGAGLALHPAVLRRS